MRREHRDEQPTDPSHDQVLDHQRQLDRARQGRIAKLLFALFLVVMFIVFIVQNSNRTRIDYVFFHRDTRLIWIMLACGILGGLVGFLVGRPGKQVRLRKRARHEKD